MSILTFYLEADTALGGSHSCRAGILAKFICVMDQSLAHSPPRLRAQKLCLYFSPGTARGLNPVLLCQNSSQSAITSWFLFCFSVCSYTRSGIPQRSWWHGQDRDVTLCPKASPAGQPGFPFTALLSQHCWVHTHMSDAGHHWTLPWGEQQKYRVRN